MNLKKWIRRQFKRKSRIYIRPTRMGGYFNGLVFLLFLLSVGYNNNLLLIFTLFLFALNLMWIIQTHFYLNALKLNSLSLENGHCGDDVMVTVRWKKTPSGTHKWDLCLENDDQNLTVRAIVNADLSSKGLLVFPRRGLWNFDHLLVSSEMPFGLYKVWTFLPVKVRAHAYPSKVAEFSEPQEKLFQQHGETPSFEKGPHDVWNLAPYNQSESRKISWKHYARSGELVIKEGEEFKAAEVKFRLDSEKKDMERVLSIMATQMIFCQKSQLPFSLETPQMKAPTGTGEKHLHECLRILSLC